MKIEKKVERYLQEENVQKRLQDGRVEVNKYILKWFGIDLLAAIVCTLTNAFLLMFLVWSTSIILMTKKILKWNKKK